MDKTGKIGFHMYKDNDRYTVYIQVPHRNINTQLYVLYTLYIYIYVGVRVCIQ